MGVPFPKIQFKKCQCGGDFFPSGNGYTCVRCGAVVPVRKGIDVKRDPKNPRAVGRPASRPPSIRDEFDPTDTLDDPNGGNG